MDAPYKIQGRIKLNVARMWYKFYPEDAQTKFLQYVDETVKQTFTVLEIGAGSGRGDQQAFPLKGKVSRYIGIDLDFRVLDNPYLDEAHVADASRLPFENDSIDMVFNTMVAEHLSDPLIVLRETFRVLKPGGIMLFETVNKRYYPMIVASMTPHWIHEFYIKRFASGRKSHDVFPTYYNLNTRKSIMAICQKAGFTKTEIFFNSLPPGYLRFNRFAFLLGVFYERTIEKKFPSLRGRIVVKCIK